MTDIHDYRYDDFDSKGTAEYAEFYPDNDGPEYIACPHQCGTTLRADDDKAWKLHLDYCEPQSMPWDDDMYVINMNEANDYMNEGD